MAFDEKKFMNTQFVPREKDIGVPDMKEFFGKDEKPVFRVRGLTGNELARVHEAIEKHKGIAGLIEKIMVGNTEEKIDAVRNALGVSAEVPEEIAKRLEMFVLGSVCPKISLEVAVRICETYPIEFYTVTTEITQLTGRGQLPGKPTPSGGTPKSEQ